MSEVYKELFSSQCQSILRGNEVTSRLLPRLVCARLRSVTRKKRAPGAVRTVRMGPRPVSLKELAERLGLSPATVSLVINRSPVADSIPQETKDRIFAAAKKYKYRPSFFARSLRARRSFTIGVIVPEVSDGYSASVMSGVEDHLLQEGYFYFVASHRHRADLIDEYPRLFLERSVDGLIAVDTPWTLTPSVPVVTVSGHNQVKGVVNIVLDHKRAAEVALKHLLHLGHRDIELGLFYSRCPWSPSPATIR